MTTLKSMHLGTLLSAGFFSELSNLSEGEILAELEFRRKKEYSKIFGREYEPEPISDDYRLALQDSKKFLDIDLEADVCKENKVYVSLLDLFAKASKGYFSPTNIEEYWESDKGPIHLSFMSNNKKIEFDPEFGDDWIDERIFQVIKREMDNTPEQFHFCAGPCNEWIGQNVIFIRLTDEERRLLEESLYWEFFNT